MALKATKFDEIDEKDEGQKVTRLRTSINESFRHLLPFRENRLKFLRQYISGHYGEHRGGLPNNLIFKYITIMKRFLVPNVPRGKVETFIADLKPDAAGLEQALNIRLEDMKIKVPLKQLIVESMVSMGIMKVGLNFSETVEVGGWEHDVMKPFVEVIQFENFVWDTTAETWEQISFCGNKYKLPLEDIVESGLFDKDAIEEIRGRGESDNLSAGEFHAIEFTTGRSAGNEDFKTMVTLWDIWLPKENSVITLVDDSTIILRQVEWFGPESGPYHLLSYDVVPGNIMPIAPVSQLYDLHMMNNNVMRKTANQAIRQKTVQAVESGGGDDAETINAASDGDAIRVKNVNGVKEISLGGLTPGNAQFVGFTGELFNEMSGNINTIGGLGSEADTLGQEKLLAQNSSKQLKDMADQATAVIGDIIKAVAFYLWNDPLLNVPIKKKVIGVPGLEVLTTFNGQDKTGEFTDYDLNIHPFSLQERSPGEDVQVLLQIVREVYMPMIQQAEAQGIRLDVAALLTNIGDKLNIPDLSEVIAASGGDLTQREQSGVKEARQAPNTTRTNIRRNVSSEKNNPLQELANSIGEQQPNA